MKPSDRQWPAQRAPDDFVDRVVRAGLESTRASGVALADLRSEEGDLESPPRGARRGVAALFRRAAVGWSFAAAATFGAVGLYFLEIRPDAESRARFAVEPPSFIEQEVTRQAEEIVVLRAKVAALEDDRTRAQLKSKLSEASAMKASAAQRAQGTKPAARPATSRPACNCPPGDALCACL
jgi:hypothetical protein